MASVGDQVGRHLRSMRLHSVPRIRSFIPGVVALAAVGCQGLDSAEETYCDTLGSGVAPCPTDINPLNDWSCLDTPPPMLGMPRPPTEPVAFVLPVVEWGTLGPLAGQGLTSFLCSVTQFECPMPSFPPYPTVAGSLGGNPLPPGATGIPVYEGFDGFVKFDVVGPPGVPDGAPDDFHFVPLTYYLGGTVSGDVTQGPPLLMIRKGDFKAVIRQTFRIDPATTQGSGTLIVGAYDCDGAPVTDARVEINAPPTNIARFQLPLARIPFAQPSGQPLYTGSSGLVGFANVPPGAVHIDVYRRGDTTPFGQGDVGVVADQISVGPMRPAFLNDANLSGARIADAPTTPTTTP
jgi:hypothetical protein